LLARELEIRRIVVPPYAGNFSAWGLLGADLTQSAARTRIMRLAEGVVDEANSVVASLFDAIAARAAARNGYAETTKEIAADMRYVGQEHTITIPLRSEDGRISARVDEIRDAFTEEYRRTFGHEMDDEVEIVSLRATLRTPLPRRAGEHLATTASDIRGQLELDAYSFTQGEWIPFRVLQRAQVEGTLEGPAIVLEETATTYLDAGFEARVHESGSLFVSDTRGT